MVCLGTHVKNKYSGYHSETRSEDI